MPAMLSNRQGLRPNLSERGAQVRVMMTLRAETITVRREAVVGSKELRRETEYMTMEFMPVSCWVVITATTAMTAGRYCGESSAVMMPTFSVGRAPGGAFREVWEPEEASERRDSSSAMSAREASMVQVLASALRSAACPLSFRRMSRASSGWLCSVSHLGDSGTANRRSNWTMPIKPAVARIRRQAESWLRK